MPLTEKGKKIKAAFIKEYGKKEGEENFYKAQNKGTIRGTHLERSGQKAKGRKK